MSKRTSEREQIRGVARRWREQYRHVDGSWAASLKGSKEDIYQNLCKLDVETATADDVAKIIGNDSWVKPWGCTECRNKGWNVVQVGEDPDYESNTAYLCQRCLQNALSL